jgi:hypothetical protein
VAEDELVELAGAVVRAERLLPDAAGIHDAALQAAVDRVHSEPGWEPMPRSGWRILLEEEDRVVVGAYDDANWHGWATLVMLRSGDDWHADRAAFGQHPRPTAATRGRGFSLEFSRPTFTCRRGESPHVTVTLTKQSDGRFRDTTSWCAFGRLTDIRTGQQLPVEERIAVAAVGRDLDLGRGDTAELPVLLTTRGVDALAPGEYGIEASFDDLDLKATDGRLTVI